MKCRHCLKELNTRSGYCPFCGMALKPSTEAENRKIPDTKVLLPGILFVVGFPTIGAFVVITFKDGLQDAVHSVPYFLAVALVALLVFLIRPIYDMLRGRSLPLIKRAAVVAGKRNQRHRRAFTNYITFSFPDKTFLEFESRGFGRKLEVGSRIILKYKLFGKFQPRPVIYGYERIKEHSEA